MDITKIHDIDKYLQELDIIKKNTIIIISVKDTLGLNLRIKSAELLKELGIHYDLNNKHGHVYYAIISHGELIVEKLSDLDGTISETITLNENCIYVKSSVYLKENISIIDIDGVDYSINLRGINIVVYDDIENQIVDTVCFDTHVKANICYRHNNKLFLAISSMSNQIQILKNSLAKLSHQIDELNNKSTTDFYRNEMILWQIYKVSGENDYAARKRFFRSLPQATGTLRKIQLAGLILLIKFDQICRDNNIEYWISFGTLIGAVRHNGFIPWDDDTDVGMLREDIYKLQNALKDNKDFYVDEFYAVRHSFPSNLNHNYQFHFAKKGTPYSLDIFVYDYTDKLDNTVIEKLKNTKKQMGDESLSLVSRIDTKIKEREKSKQYGDEFQKLFEKYYCEQKRIIGDVEQRKYMIWAIDNTMYAPAYRSYLPTTYVFPLTEIEFEGHSFMAPNDPEAYANILFKDIYRIPDDILSHTHFTLTDKQIDILNEVIEEYRDCI